jgi:hypothetical protein
VSGDAVTGTHTYTAAGVYTATLTVEGVGTSGAASHQYVVVYDPSAGFVTGGGWIDSPAGAYPADPDLTGRASFGFNAKYRRGQSVPDGQTQFQFQVAAFSFRSTAYEWLVVSGPQAKFKGIGQVNGAGDYGFMLTARDGQQPGGGGDDRFRIKIWDRATSSVVYDNQMGEGDDSPAATVLGGGSVVIHPGGGASALLGGEIPERYTLATAYPNPFSRRAALRFGLPEAAHATLVVYDALGREVARLVDGEQEAGWHVVSFDAGRLASGVYIVRFAAGGVVETQRLTLLR